MNMKTRLLSSTLALVSIAATVMASSGAHATAYSPFIGVFHSHSGYSDGWPGSTPATYFASGKSHGMDFLFGGEHSDNFVIPLAFSHYCTDNPGADSVQCATEDSDKVTQALKWQGQLDQAKAATTDAFTARRGFEWTSDVYGHIDVIGSTNEENAKTDGGYGVTMETFYNWFTRATELNGGGDALAAFAHPGAKCRLNGYDNSFCDWNQFAFVPAADQRMFAIELFNYRDEYDKYYTQVLDQGWHTGAIGAEDIGHDRPDHWGDARFPKTIILATGRSWPELKAAMLARRTYAIRSADLRLDFHVNGAMMGSRLSVAPGEPVTIDGSINKDLALDVVTSGGVVVGTGLGSVHVTVPASASQRYYYLRAHDILRNQAYSSPVWITAA